MIKRILGGKSKNLCDVAYLLTLPFDKNFERYGFGEVEINVEPNTAYTLSRENSDLINLGYVTYFGLANEHDNPTPDDAHHKWLNHQTIPSRCRKSVTLTSNSDGKLWVFFSGSVYNCWQKNLNPFGYIQLELGSTATEYVPYELTSYKSIMKVNDVCQLLDKSKYRVDATDQGITFTNNGDGSWTVVGTAPDDPTNHSYVEYSILILDKAFTTKHFIPGHKIIVGGGKVENVAWVQWILSWSGGYIAANSSNINSYTITEYPENFTGNFICLRVQKGQTVNFTFKPQLFDLTEMFGAGNEPKTVDEFKAKFPNDYYPYSPSCFVTSYDERMPCKTKNLFSSSTEVSIPSSTKFDRSEKRLLEDGKWYIGLAGSNYYSQDAVLDYSIMENSVYVKWKSNGYAVAKCIYCEPNTTYSFTNKYSLIQGHSLGINVGFYTEDGTFISFKPASPRFVFTTPENCKYVSICLSGTRFPDDNFGAGCFSDLQLVKGSTATDYVPYEYV